MKFVLVDRISTLEPGRRIIAHKALSLAEEYLADHFPTFPVLPGVFLLEAMVQASAWVVRTGLDFAPSLVLLKEARNVTYRSFLAPGEVLTIDSTCREMNEQESVFQASGRTGEREIVKGVLTLRHIRLLDVDSALAGTDDSLRDHFRKQLGLIWHGEGSRAAPVAV